MSRARESFFVVVVVVEVAHTAYKQWYACENTCAHIYMLHRDHTKKLRH